MNHAQPGLAILLSIRIPYFVKELDCVKGEYQSVNGQILSGWKREGDKVILTVTIPPNTTATVYADKIHLVKSGVHQFVVK